jgi:hypothetical protein
MIIVEEAVFEIPRRFGPVVRALADEVNRISPVTLQVVSETCPGEEDGRCKCKGTTFVARGLEHEVKGFISSAERTIYNMLLLTESGIVNELQKLFDCEEQHEIPNN